MRNVRGVDVIDSDRQHALALCGATPRWTSRSLTGTRSPSANRLQDLLDPVDKAIAPVGPCLHHVPALVDMLRLVVDSAPAALLMREALLDPVRLEASLLEHG